MTDIAQEQTAVADFEITSWDPQETEEERAEGATLARTRLTKRFSGALTGTSVTHLLTAMGPEGRGYVAMERVDGTLDGREGSFVIGHGGLDDDSEAGTFGSVVPGSGTGALAGLRGRCAYVHDGDTAQLSLTYTLANG